VSACVRWDVYGIALAQSPNWQSTMNTIPPALDRVMAATTVNDLEDAMISAANALGFRWGTAIIVRQDVDGRSTFTSIGSIPEGYGDIYNDVESAQNDPVLQVVKKTHVPVLWDRSYYEQAGQGAMWEEQARFGLVSGVMVAMHMPGGRHFALGVDADQALTCDARARSELVGQVQLLMVHTESALEHLVADHELVARGEHFHLTRRELACLQWSSLGKTAWEVSQIIGISERVARKHLESAIVKLDCTSKVHAVAKALRMGQIN
jgi:DNA-binding CsgD family transcriptional regulator